MKSFQVVHFQLSVCNIVPVVLKNRKSKFKLLIPFSGGNVLNFTKMSVSADFKCFNSCKQHLAGIKSSEILNLECLVSESLKTLLALF